MSKRSRILDFLGTFLIVAAFVVPLVYYRPLIQVELSYRLQRLFYPRESIIAKDPYETIMNIVPDSEFSLYIPKIDANQKVFKNVSVVNKKEYFNVLKNGIAHAEGTVLPGSIGNIYLFAHSTDSPLNILRYNAVFYLLRELDNGDEVFIAYEGKPYRYVVYDRKIVEPTDVSYLKAENEDGKEQVIMQTCWPPGTVLKRLLVFAERKDMQQAGINQ